MLYLETAAPGTPLLYRSLLLVFLKHPNGPTSLKSFTCKWEKTEGSSAAFLFWIFPHAYNIRNVSIVECFREIRFDGKKKSRKIASTLAVKCNIQINHQASLHLIEDNYCHVYRVYSCFCVFMFVYFKNASLVFWSFSESNPLTWVKNSVLFYRRAVYWKWYFHTTSFYMFLKHAQSSLPCCQPLGSSLKKI